MTFQSLLVDVRDGIATVTVNRPDKLNSLDAQAIAELRQAALALKGDGAVKGVIVTGAGPKAFVAGADISELASQGPLDGRERALRGQAAFDAFATMGKPVVAAVNGFALGAGCELAMACHLRVASENAKFGQPEVKLGITPGYGGTQRLPRIVGLGRALHLLMTGETIDAEEALRIGLVTKVVPREELAGEAEKLLRAVLANGPVAVALTAEAALRGREMSLEEGLKLEADLFGLVSATEDMKEGTRAFLEKRPPRFAGK